VSSGAQKAGGKHPPASISNPKIEPLQPILSALQALASITNLDALMDAIASAAVDLVNASGGLAGLRERHGLAAKKYLHQGQVRTIDLFWPPGHGLPGKLLLHKAPCRTDEAPPSHPANGFPSDIPYRSALAVPILGASDDVIGFIQVHDKQNGGPFTPADQQTLLLFASLASITLQKALALQIAKVAEEALQKAEVRAKAEEAQRKSLEEQLSKNQKQLNILLENAVSLLSSAGPASVILGANQAERDLVLYLRRAKDNLASILNSIAEGITVQDSLGNVVYINEAASQLLDHSHRQVIDTFDDEDTAPPLTVYSESAQALDGHPLVQLPLKTVPNTSRTERFKNRVTGAERIAIVRSKLVSDEQGQVHFVVSIYTDITELKQAQEALDREHQLTARRVENLDAMAKGLFSIGLMPFSHSIDRVLDVTQKTAGAAYAGFYSYNPASRHFEIVSARPALQFQGFAAPPSPSSFEAPEFAGPAGPRRQSLYIADSSRDPHWRHLLSQHGSIYLVSVVFGNRIHGAILLISDRIDGISEEERFMADTVAAYGGTILENARLYEQVQALAIRDERIRVSHEIHDGLAQILSYVNAQAQAVELVLAAGDVQEGRRQMKELSESARTAYQDVRESMLALRSQLGPGRSFYSALQEYLSGFRRLKGGDLDIRLGPLPEGLELSPLHEVQVLRIIQEAVTNVRKHARATGMEIRFSQKASHLEVEIIDNGVGFNPKAVQHSGFPRLGLTTMHERALAIGCRLEIDSAPGHGTRIRLRAAKGLHIPRQEARP
jgi:PAS domain S-box-containing protein